MVLDLLDLELQKVAMKVLKMDPSPQLRVFLAAEPSLQLLVYLPKKEADGADFRGLLYCNKFSEY